MRPLLGVVVLFLLGAASWAQEARDAARAIMSRPEYQSTLPEPGREADQPVSAPESPRSKAPEARLDVGPFAGMVGMMIAFLLWGVVIVVIAALIVWLLREFVLRPPKRSPVAARAAARAGEDDDQVGLPTREAVLALAAAGRLDEAIHALFVRSVRAVGADTSTRDRALTAREIVARARLAPELRAALAGIAEVTERILFRRDPVDVARFERCLAWHDRIAEGRDS